MNKLLKSVGAVFAGAILGAVLSIATDTILESLGILPPITSPQLYVSWMLILALVYRSVYTIAGGYVTARLAPNRPMLHAIILGAIGTIVTLLGSIANWDKTTPSTIWYPIMLILVTLPCTWLGAQLKNRKNF